MTSDDTSGAELSDDETTDSPYDGHLRELRQALRRALQVGGSNIWEMIQKVRFRSFWQGEGEAEGTLLLFAQLLQERQALRERRFEERLLQRQLQQRETEHRNNEEEEKKEKKDHEGGRPPSP